MDNSYLSNAHPGYIDQLYTQYKNDAGSVDIGWRRFFEGFDFAQQQNSNGAATDTPSTAFSPNEFKVFALIDGYRKRGHLLSTTNPIRPRRDRHAKLDIEDYGLTKADLSEKFAAGVELGMGTATLADIVERLQHIYCKNIGFEFLHIEDNERREWLRQRVETYKADDFGLSIEKKRRILEMLNGAVGFENFLAKKYIAQKRFGLEGGETIIAGLDALISKAAELDVKEVVMGMAHRGRLNVLANILGKTYAHIFNEFEGNAMPDQAFGGGDVKYHMGYSSIRETFSGKSVHIKLSPNPSHLEAVNTVVEGFARAKADILYNSNFDEVFPILIHGDAATAGQGIVYETVQMSQLEGYYTGGTMHLVINNQIGFTTDFDDARSATYCTDVAKVVQVPVFHVNGDDPEAMVYICELAAEYRQKFNTDVFIDMVCYRKNGHNEGDDPKFTQPKLYNLIKDHKDPRTVFSEKLIQTGVVEKELAEKMEIEFNSFLQARLDEVKEKPLPYQYQEPELAWKKMKKHAKAEDFKQSPKTAIPLVKVKKILKKLQEIPESIKPIKKFSRLLKTSQKHLDNEVADWAMGEHLAYGSLLLEGHDIRMSGQDVKRGTFSHRNAILYDVETNKQYNRLNHLDNKQGKFNIYNSLLSEFGVLGFEYGYSIATPESLVIWEAQFGDFANGAQTIFDQFISSSESKWNRMSGMVILLPHGYEGQGPEHSSARLERFLLMCAEFNMTVVNITTSANFFHVIRRQLMRPFRKPLIVMSPKKHLRGSLSPLSDFSKGGFKEVIDDESFTSKAQGSKVKKVLLCSGKVYYELLAKREKDNRRDVAIVRVEQLYPFPINQIEAIDMKYSNATFYWVQEEPENMGAWQYILGTCRPRKLQVISRPASASPASGYKKVHDLQELELLEKAFS